MGNGRPPASNRECLPALLYVLASGISWEMLPWCFPSYKTVQRRLRDGLREDAFLKGWGQRAERYQRLHGINGDQILRDGSKKPSQKGGRDGAGPGRSRQVGHSHPPGERRAGHAPGTHGHRGRGQRRVPDPQGAGRPGGPPTGPGRTADTPDERMARRATNRAGSGPHPGGAACRHPVAGRSGPGSARCPMRSSDATTSSHSSGASGEGSAVMPGTTSGGANWPHASSSYDPVLSGSPKSETRVRALRQKPSGRRAASRKALSA